MNHVSGLPELLQFLDDLPGLMQRNILRGAALKAMQMVAAKGRENLESNRHQVTGELLGSLQPGTRAIGQFVTGYVKLRGPHSYLGWFLEYGVAPHGTRKGAKRKSGKYQDGVLNPGFDPKPFLRPALDSQREAIIPVMADYIRLRCTREGLRTPDPSVKDDQ